ncbi:MAG: UDP-N-acetylglucosamine 1-carboxyvinyltransferase, partial [Kiritimatiellae bacterium]|nr:UDP-N-acetylglucosamine 1-carboxyvinyltransferase [Kiritimatiellia bacterium]
MSRFVIHGGVPVSGVHRLPGNKNAALPMLAASLLTAEPVTLTNVPWIEDVQTMLSLLDEVGAAVERDVANHTVRICTRQIRRTWLSKKNCEKVRSSVLFAG